MSAPFSVIVPVYNEGERIVGSVERLVAACGGDAEILVVYDFPADTTVPFIEQLSSRYPGVRGAMNDYGRGPGNAIRYGLDHAAAPIGVVTMADASDDSLQIPEMAGLVDQGAVVAAASRYMRGGRQEGGPLLKRTLSRMAGLSLYYLARVGIHDATNSFKAYDLQFVRSVGVESRAGFEIAIELVAKARRHRRRVVEIPTTWRDRTDGESNFKLWKWLPKYLRWYFYAFGPPKRGLTTEGN